MFSVFIFAVMTSFAKKRFLQPLHLTGDHYDGTKT